MHKFAVPLLLAAGTLYPKHNTVKQCSTMERIEIVTSVMTDHIHNSDEDITTFTSTTPKLPIFPASEPDLPSITEVQKSVIVDLLPDLPFELPFDDIPADYLNPDSQTVTMLIATGLVVLLLSFLVRGLMRKRGVGNFFRGLFFLKDPIKTNKGSYRESILIPRVARIAKAFFVMFVSFVSVLILMLGIVRNQERKQTNFGKSSINTLRSVPFFPISQWRSLEAVALCATLLVLLHIFVCFLEINFGILFLVIELLSKRATSRRTKESASITPDANDLSKALTVTETEATSTQLCGDKTAIDSKQQLGD